MQQIKVKSHLSVPFSAEGAIFGSLVLVAVKSHRAGPEVIIQRLQLIGRIFANALMRKRAELELQNAFSEIKRLNDRLEADNDYLSEEIRIVHNFEEIVGQSKSLKKVFKEIEQIAPTDTTVLILGETGTGKELAARALHNDSRRKDRPLIKVDCYCPAFRENRFSKRHLFWGYLFPKRRFARKRYCRQMRFSPLTPEQKYFPYLASRAQYWRLPARLQPN